jgi:DNA-binding transcriptional MerR regulator
VIRIGDFARLAGVSIETLRHYDELGVLRPARVDGFTGYRYYAAEQLARLNRIVALKDLGFSLKQIEEVLDGITLERLSGMLDLARVQAERRLEEDQIRLARIASRLRQLELEEVMPNYDVIVKDLPPVLVAAKRVTVPTNDQVPQILGRAFDDAYALVKRTGAKEAGPCLAIWHQPAAVLANEVVEAAVQIDRTVKAAAGVEVYELTGGPAAAVIHTGPFPEMVHAHAVLLSWMDDNGYEPAGTYREIYHQDPGQDGHAVVEIQYPVVVR